MSADLRVLHVFGSMDRGGAETRIVEVMRRLDRRQVAFDFLVLSGRPGAYADEIARLGGRIVALPGPRHLGRLLALLRTGGWNVVHSHVHHFSGLVLLAARAAGIGRRLAHLHTCGTGQVLPLPRRLYERAMHRLIDGNATTVMAVSEAAMHSFYGDTWRTDPRRVVRYNGVDVDRFHTAVDHAALRRTLGVPPGHALLLHVGNFHPPKNHAALIAIAARLVAQHIPFVLALVGDGPGRPAIEAAIRAHSLQQFVRVLGARDDVADLLHAADCFVFPSRWEGLPGAVLEALAAGTPIVASAIPPVEEIARQTTGITCVDPNDIDGFATRIMQQLGDRPRTTLPSQFTAAATLDGLLGCYA